MSTTLARVLVVVAAAALLAACGSQTSSTASTPPASKLSVKPSASTTPELSSTPQSTAAAKPSCTPGGPDLLVRYVVPGIHPSAQTLGSEDIVNCQPTITMLQKTSPTRPGYCTQVAYASDNPGYDLNADPAPPLKHMIAAFGGGC